VLPVLSESIERGLKPGITSALIFHIPGKALLNLRPHIPHVRQIADKIRHSRLSRTNSMVETMGGFKCKKRKVLFNSKRHSSVIFSVIFMVSLQASIFLPGAIFYGRRNSKFARTQSIKVYVKMSSDSSKHRINNLPPAITTWSDHFESNSLQSTLNKPQGFLAALQRFFPFFWLKLKI
jgi:hypothetical protein